MPVPVADVAASRAVPPCPPVAARDERRDMFMATVAAPLATAHVFAVAEPDAVPEPIPEPVIVVPVLLMGAGPPLMRGPVPEPPPR